MNDDQFNDLIRGRLQNHESFVPANMWERITENKNKPKSGFALRFCLLILAMAVLSLPTNFFYINNKNSKDLVFNKNNTDNILIKKGMSELKNKTVSLPDINTIKENNLGKINNPFRTNKQIKTLSFKRRKKESWSDSYNQLQIVNQRNKAANSNDLTNYRKTFNYQDNIIDSFIKKPNKDSNSAASASLDKLELKEDEINNDKFSIELYISPDRPFNEITSFNKSYERVLNKAFSAQLSYTIGARMNYEISKKISAKIGIQYAQINEKTAFQDSASIHNFTSANHYKNISVPLLVSYKTRWISNLNLSVNTGILLNLTSHYKGVIPSVSGQPIEIISNNVYDNNVNATFYLGIDISKRINRSTDVFAEPWFNYRFKNMVSPYYLFQQKIHTSGISFGLRYRLFKNK